MSYPANNTRIRMAWLTDHGHLFNRKPTSRRPSRRSLTVELMEDRIVLSWPSVPPPSVPVPTSYTSVALNSLNDASGPASIDSNEIDWYRFAAPSTGSYTLAATTPLSSLDPVIGLYNSSGVRLAYNDDFGGTLDSQTTASLNAGQTFYLGVTNYQGTLTSGSYTWSINGPNDDVYENNDTLTTATNLGTLPGPVRTYSGLQVRDADWYRFTTTASGLSSDYVRINFTHAQGDIDLALYDAGGNFLASSTSVTNQEQISLAGRAAGTYYIQVYGYLGAQNPNYSLTIEPPDDQYENNDTRPTATDLGTLPGPVRTYTGLRLADDDWYRFTTTASGLSSDYVRINFTHAQGDIDLALYDAGGNFLASSTSVTNQEQISLAGRAAGTYYIQVYGYLGAQNPNYSLTIEPPDDQYENNDTRATAYNLGSTYYGTKTWTGLRLADDDWYSFTTPWTGHSVDFVRINFTHSLGDVDMALYNTAGTFIASSTSTTNQEQISLSGLPAGTYSVRVYGFMGAQNPSYSLTTYMPAYL